MEGWIQAESNLNTVQLGFDSFLQGKPKLQLEFVESDTTVDHEQFGNAWNKVVDPKLGLALPKHVQLSFSRTCSAHLPGLAMDSHFNLNSTKTFSCSGFFDSIFILSNLMYIYLFQWDHSRYHVQYNNKYKPLISLPYTIFTYSKTNIHLKKVRKIVLIINQSQ